MSRRLIAFVMLGVACVAAPVIYILRARVPAESAMAVVKPGAGVPVKPGGRQVAFRYTGPGDMYGRLVTGELGAAGGDEVATALRCDRLDLAARHGVCLAARRGVFTTYEAILFDGDFQTRHTLPLSGTFY